MFWPILRKKVSPKDNQTPPSSTTDNRLLGKETRGRGAGSYLDPPGGGCNSLPNDYRMQHRLPLGICVHDRKAGPALKIREV
jgi:hypothetical protein